MGMKKLDQYRTGMYLRLSSGDDDRDGKGKIDSNSITNQKLLVEDFMKNKPEFKLAEIFIDDGFSGSNFERPAYQKMMKAVEAGKLDCIIVKDLSRIAREHIGGDELILKTFDKYGVRFIAITDNFDSLTADHGEKHIIVPMKNLINDNYCHDISTKVRSSQQVKRANGEFVGAFAPYGYAKAEENKNQLVPDEYAAVIIQDIFAKKLAGMSASAIANELNSMGVLSPAAYKKKSGQKYSTSFQSAGDSKWSAQTVGRILKDVVYVGVLAQGKRTRINHKVKKEVLVPKCDWITIENAHEPIVSMADFNAVQILMSRDTKAIAGQKEAYMYAGLLYCGDCGMSMVRRSYLYRGKPVVNYICSNYNRNGKDNCNRHSIREEVLDEIILGQLQIYMDNMRDCEALVEHLDELNVNYDEAVAHDKEITGLRAELTKYAALKSSLYNDLQEGIITKEQFARYRETYTGKEVELETAIQKQEKIIHSIYHKGLAVADDLAKFRENFRIKELDRLVLVTFIDRILIYEDTVEIVFKYSNEMEKVDKFRQQKDWQYRSARSHQLGIVGLFIVITILMKFGIILNNEMIQFMPMFVFAIYHGSQKYGIKNVGIWFVITWIVSNFFEGLSIAMGFPFGNYHYAIEGVPRIWNVPVLIMVSYFAIVYTSWIMALTVTNHLNKKIEGAYRFIIPITAAVVMTMWDLITDPKASTLNGAWVWEDGGAFYGVPISNFVGWVFVVYVFLQIFTLFISSREVKAENVQLINKKSYWLQPCIVYLFMGLGIVIDGFRSTTNVEILASAGMISVFTMVFTAFIGFLNIKNSKELS